MSAADWSAPFARALTLAPADGAFLLLVNGWWEPLPFRIPQRLCTERWSVPVYTADVRSPPPIGAVDEVTLSGRSLMLLEREPSPSLTGPPVSTTSSRT